MADKTVTFELLIDASKSSQTVGELKESIKDLQSAALAAGEQGNKSLADQYIKAAGEAKDKINDLNQSIKNAGSDTRKLDGLVQIGSGIASGFAAAQGAAALFGGANKDLEKSLLKVQAATALAVGVQQIANLLQKESKAMMFLSSAATTTYSTVVGVATGKIKIATLAQQAWNAMMALNPIGLVVTAIALMTAAIYQLVTAESEEEKQLKKVNKELEYNNDERERDISYIKEQQRQTQKLYENELRLMKINGATEEEINAKKFEQIDRGLKSNAELILQEKKKIENNEKLIAGLPPLKQRTEEQLVLHEKYADVIDKSNINIFDLTQANDDLNISYQELSNSLNGVTESQEADAEAKKKQSEYLKNLSESGSPGSIGYYNFLLGESNTRLGKLVPGTAAYNAELKKNIKLQKDLAATQQAAKSPEELQKAADAAAKKAEELKIKQAADFAALSEKEYADSIKSTSEYYDHLIAVAKLNNEDTTALENKKAEELIGIGDEYGQKTLAQQDALLLAKKKQKEDAIKKEVDDAVKLAQENLAGGVGGSELANQIALENALYEQAKIGNTNLEELEKTHLAKIAALKKASAVKEVEAGLKMAQDSLSAIQNLSDVVYSSKLAKVKKGSKEEEAILRKQFETNKKMQIASAIINGALAVTNIIATVPKADFGVSTAIMLVAAASATAASIAKIASTKFEGGGSSGGSVDIPNIAAPPETSAPSIQNQSLLGNDQSTQAGTKVFVTESDIKKVTGRVSVIENQARFG